MNIIPKFGQGGGAYASAFADFVVRDIPKSSSSTKEKSSTTTTTKSSSDSDSGKLSLKDLEGILKDIDGLPNDVSEIILYAQRLYDQQSILSDNVDMQSIMNKVLIKAKNAQYSKEVYKNAVTEARNKGGMSEAVFNSSGLIQVLDISDKSLKYISIKDYLSNTDKYQTINAETTFALRAKHPSKTYDDDDVMNAAHSIGMDEVVKAIKSRMGSIGTSTMRTEGLSLKQGQAIAGGVQVLDDLAKLNIGSNMTIDGLYSYQVINKELEQQAKAALAFIYNSLTTLQRAMLQLKSGNALNPDQGAQALIGQLIMSQESPEKSFKTDYVGSVTSDGKLSKTSKSGSSDGEDTDKMKLSAAEMFVSGMGYHETVDINAGGNEQIRVASTQMPLVEDNGDSLGIGCTLSDVAKSQYGSVLDFKHAIMGGKKVSLNGLDRIKVNTQFIHSVDFPVDDNGNPDLSVHTMSQMKQLQQTLSDMGIDINDLQSRAEHSKEINDVMQQLGFQNAYDKNGNIIGSKWRRFAVLDCTADGRALGMNVLDNNDLLDEITDDAEIDNFVESLSTKEKKYDFSSGFLGMGGDSLYQGTIFIPMQVSHINAQVGGKKDMTAPQAQAVETMLLENDALQSSRLSYVKPTDDL